MAYIGAAVTKDSDIKRITFATSTTGSGPFAIGWAPDSEASLRVTINGVVQQGSDITISGSNLTISETLISGDELEVVGIVSVGSTMVPQDGSVTIAKMARAGTSGQVLTTAGTGADATWSAPDPVKFLTKTDVDYTVVASDFDDCQHLWLYYVNTIGSTLKAILPTPANFTGKIVSVSFEGGSVSGYNVYVYESDGTTQLTWMQGGSGGSSDAPDIASYWSDGTDYRRHYIKVTQGGGL